MITTVCSRYDVNEGLKYFVYHEHIHVRVKRIYKCPNVFANLCTRG